MSAIKTIEYIDNVEVKTTTAYSEVYTGLADGSHIYKVEMYDGTTLVDTKSKNFTKGTSDTTAPTITTATVEDANPDKLVVVFSEVVTITNTTGLTITGDATLTLSAPTGSGSNTITFTLSAALTSSQSVTLNVASSNTIIDAANNALAAATKAITNNVAAASATYDAKTTAYMNAVGTPNDSTASIYPNKTNADIWTLCEQVVQYINTNNAWGGVKTLHPMQGNTATKNSYNLKDTTTFPMTFFGGWIHDAQGNKGNGTNTYGKFGFVSNMELVVENSAIIISSLTETVNSVVVPVGGGDGTSNRIIISQKYDNKFFNIIGNDLYEGASTSAIGIMSVSRKDSLMATKVNNILINEMAQSGNLPPESLSYGAYNTQAYTDNYLGSFATSTADVESIITEALIMWEEGLGRITI